MDHQINDTFLLPLLQNIFEEATNKLEILEKINGWPLVSADLNFQNILQSSDNKYVHITKTGDELNIEKVQHDCNLLKQIFQQTHESLVDAGSFHPLKKLFGKFAAVQEENREILRQARETKREHDRLTRALDEEKRRYFEAVQGCTEGIGRVKDEIVDFNRQTEMQMQFLIEWENAKCETKQLEFEVRRRQLEEEVKLKSLQVDREERVHCDRKKLLEGLIKDLNRSSDDWNQRYDESLVKINEDIKDLRDKKCKVAEETLDMLNLYKQREEEMVQYEEHKEMMRLQREEMDRRINACVIIQSWWRGTMVRKGFGPYRKKKEKKAKKKEAPKS